MAEILYKSDYYGVSSLGNSLKHYGIKNQKWGVRRFQYENGILTPAGRARYDVGPREKTSKTKTKSNNSNETGTKSGATSTAVNKVSAQKKSEYKKMKSSVNVELKKMLSGKNYAEKGGASSDANSRVSRALNASSSHGKTDDLFDRQAIIDRLIDKIEASYLKRKSVNTSKSGSKSSAINSSVIKSALLENLNSSDVNLSALLKKKDSSLLKQKVKRKIQNG